MLAASTATPASSLVSAKCLTALSNKDAAYGVNHTVRQYPTENVSLHIDCLRTPSAPHTLRS